MVPTTGARPPRRSGVAVAGAVLLAALLAGCGADSTMSDQAGGAPAMADRATVDQGAPDGSGGDDQVRGAVAYAVGTTRADAAPAALPRQIIRTATITVAVADLDEAASAVRALGPSVGGLVATEKSDRPPAEDDESSSGTTVIELRVPADKLDAAVARLAALGTVRARALTSEDVTSQVADLDGRVATQRAALERVRQLLAKATNVKDVLALEADLTQRESDLEGMMQRLAALRGQVALSSLTVTLVGEDSAVDEDQPRKGFRGGLSAGWSALSDTSVAASAVAGALLPWCLPGAIVAAVVVALRRRRRRSVPPPSAPPSWAGTPGPVAPSAPAVPVAPAAPVKVPAAPPAAPPATAPADPDAKAPDA
ncbi:MAG: DUF4349 domain-containing protein [Kineosporiaceae bacterium]